jgi:hypothetical protein
LISLGKVLKFPVKLKRDPDPTFQEFDKSIRDGDPDRAGRVLKNLFLLSESRARAAANFLYARFSADPGTLDLLRINLRISIAGGNTNTALFLLAENFGFDGPESLHVLTAIAEKFGKTQ